MKVGILGTGWGRTHVGTFRRAGAEVAVIASSDPERSERVAREENVPSWRVEDLEDVDVVVIATPWRMHREHVQRFAHKKILCEKPLLGVVPDAEFRERARSLDAHVAYAFPFLPFAPALADAIARAPRFDLEVRVALPNLPDATSALREVGVHPIALLVHALGAIRCERVTVREGSRIEIEVGGARAGRIAVRLGGDRGFSFHLVAGDAKLDGGYVWDAGWGFEGHGPPRHETWYEANCALVETFVALHTGRIDAREARLRGLLHASEALVVEDVIGIEA